MSVMIRGAENALRNPARTGSIVLLLGVAATRGTDNKCIDILGDGQQTEKINV